MNFFFWDWRHPALRATVQRSAEVVAAFYAEAEFLSSACGYVTATASRTYLTASVLVYIEVMSAVTVPQAVQLGNRHYVAGRLAEAEAMYRWVLQASPRHHVALHYLGAIALQRRQVGIAIDLMRQSIAEAPNVADYHSNMGLALVAAKRFEEALASQRRVIALAPAAPEAYSDLANTLVELGRTEEAIENYRKELSLRPAAGKIWSNLGWTLAETGRIAEAIACYRRGIASLPENAALHGNLLTLVQFDPTTSAAEIQEEHRKWSAKHAAPLAREIRPHSNDRTPGRRLRIGYVTADFREHVVGRSLLPVLANHDKGCFEVYCYSGSVTHDDMTRQIRSHADVWRDTGDLNDAQLAEQIRQDRIDVLVDLTLHMANSRMLTFARKPAPVQITYVGYAASTGLPAMDYRVTDVHLDPPGRASDGPERLLRLPHCYWAYRPPAQAPEVGPLPALRNGYVTFGSFNSFRKVNPGVIGTWAQLLRELPNSRLMLLLAGGNANTHVLSLFEHHGIRREQIQLLHLRPLDAYFRLYHDVDISLDPFPYNGGITSLDSLWMGVPFVTLAGERAVGRAGLSLLTNVGLTDLIAQSAGEYVQTTLHLARDTSRLEHYRQSLRTRLAGTALMNEKQFTCDLEALYAEAWNHWAVAYD
ncbi:MAG: repeat-containing protein [Phycisphaerales bacterium]|nr:repeat-containing protein [Phycisphaerales bacterium]